jgi:hypothetical protein
LFSTRLDLNERIIADALIEHLRGAIRSSGSITANPEVTLHRRNQPQAEEGLREKDRWA